jgi:hypothetical protein
LIDLYESRRDTLGQMGRNQEKIKNTFDHKEKKINFIVVGYCGIRERRNLVCTKSWIVYGQVLIKSSVMQVQTLST